MHGGGWQPNSFSFITPRTSTNVCVLSFWCGMFQKHNIMTISLSHLNLGPDKRTHTTAWCYIFLAFSCFCQTNSGHVQGKLCWSFCLDDTHSVDLDYQCLWHLLLCVVCLLRCPYTNEQTKISYESFDIAISLTDPRDRLSRSTLPTASRVGLSTRSSRFCREEHHLHSTTGLSSARLVQFIVLWGREQERAFSIVKDIFSLSFSSCLCGGLKLGMFNSLLSGSFHPIKLLPFFLRQRLLLFLLMQFVADSKST